MPNPPDPRRAIIRHPPTELETREIADLGQRISHPAPPPHDHHHARAQNQGEGDRASARAYAEHVQSFVVAGGVEPAARDAARAVEKPSLVDRAKGAIRRVVEVIRERRDS